MRSKKIRTRCVSESPVLPHELAHLLTNTPDSPGNVTYFYPTVSGPILTAVESGRRMPEWVVQYARTYRYSSDLNAPGNKLLSSY